MQQNLLQGFSAVPQCLQDLHPLCHKLVTEPPGLCGLICCFGPFSSSLSTGAQGCQQQWEAPWDNQMISARAEAAPVKGKFCPAHAPEGCESRAGTSRVGQFIEKSTSLLSWLQGFFLLGSGNAQGRRRAEHRGLPEDLRCHGGTWGRREGTVPQKSHQNQTLPWTKPCPKSNPSPSPFCRDNLGIPPRAGHCPWGRGSQLMSPQCSCSLLSTQPCSQLFVPAEPYSCDKFMFFRVLMLL